MADQEFITKRQDSLNAAMNAGDVDKLMEFYAEDNLDFSDYGAGALHLSNPALREFFKAMYKACTNLHISTHAVNGTKLFTAWEWSISFTYASAMDGVSMPELEAGGLTVGKDMKMIGCSVTKWNEEGRIVKNSDYSKVVETFEGR